VEKVKMDESKPVIILGAGGHASVLIDALQKQNIDIMGITDPDETRWGQEFMGIEILGSDDKLLDIHPDRVELVNGLGSVKSSSARQKLFETWHNKGYSFASVIHPKAILATSIKLAEGVQILAGAIINPNTSIGINTIVNTGAILEHDCIISNHVHVAPGVRMAGNVRVGDGAHIGIGCTILQNLSVGDGCVVGAGAVVLHSIQAGDIVVGVPAKRLG
jgi:sugar O-acyltransferase (sialic acid O-acetyltransferase NeuD family)